MFRLAVFLVLPRKLHPDDFQFDMISDRLTDKINNMMPMSNSRASEI